MDDEKFSEFFIKMEKEIYYFYKKLSPENAKNFLEMLFQKLSGDKIAHAMGKS